MRYQEQSNRWKQEVERQLPGAEGRGKWGDPVRGDEARWW